MVAQAVGQPLHHFRIGEFQPPRTPLHQDHAHTQRCEHAGVFHADHAAANHDHGFRNLRHFQDLVAIDDVPAVQRHLTGAGRLGSSGDDDHLRAIRLLASDAVNLDSVRVYELRNAVDHFDVVARQLRLDHIDFGLDHVLDAERQILHRDLFLDAVINAVNVLVVVAGKMQHGFADGLAGDGAGVDADASHNFAPLDEANFFTRLSALDGRALARGP